VSSRPAHEAKDRIQLTEGWMSTNSATSAAAIRQPTPLEAVLRRLGDSSGFPTLSATIGDINRVVASDSYSAQQLTQVILRDVSLTTKLLQLVNSAVYGQFRGSIRTVSKAVLILGGEAVRNAAMTLIMLEFSKGCSQERSMQDELVGAFFAGVVAKALCRRFGVDGEEAVICTMCQNLGRLLVTFFLYEESREVAALVATGMAEEQASQQVLGISYGELGIGVARHWSFPDRLVEGMQSLTGRAVDPVNTEVGRLRVAASLANELYATALRSSPEDRPQALNALSRRYGGAVKLDADALTDAIDRGLAEINERSMSLTAAVVRSPTLGVIRAWMGRAAESADAVGASPAPTGEPRREEMEAPDVADATDATEVQPDGALDAREVLSAGIRDVTEALTADFPLNDVLQMVIEAIHRGVGSSRTMIFVRDVRLNTMRARFGFGADIEAVLPRCSFPLDFAPDVFHVALQKGVDIVIENAQSDEIAQRIPQWHLRALGAKSFLLLPVILKTRAIGLLYADSEHAGGIRLDAEQLGLLRTLRSQVVLAFKQGTPPP
jgi:HD-like signal output (HDOD) protein